MTQKYWQNEMTLNVKHAWGKHAQMMDETGQVFTKDYPPTRLFSGYFANKERIFNSSDDGICRAMELVLGRYEKDL